MFWVLKIMGLNQPSKITISSCLPGSHRPRTWDQSLRIPGGLIGGRMVVAVISHHIFQIWHVCRSGFQVVFGSDAEKIIIMFPRKALFCVFISSSSSSSPSSWPSSSSYTINDARRCQEVLCYCSLYWKSVSLFSHVSKTRSDLSKSHFYSLYYGMQCIILYIVEKFAL